MVRATCSKAPRNLNNRNESSVRVSLFWRLGLTYMALVLAVLVCVDWFAARLLRADALRDAFNQIEALGHIARARPRTWRMRNHYAFG